MKSKILLPLFILLTASISASTLATIPSEPLVWNETTNLPFGRREHSAIVHNGRVYVIGGDK